LPTAERDDFPLDRLTIAELEDRRTDPNRAINDGSTFKLADESWGVRVFQLLASIYAVAMLVITVRVYTHSEHHPGMALFFVACTASFYIICYNALSIENALKQWLNRHQPSFRHLSIAAAAVLATIPIAVLYLMQPVNALRPSPAQTANLSVQISAPTDATKRPAAKPGNSNHIAVLTDVQYWSSPTSTTVAIDLDDQAQYEMKRLAGPDRIYLDLQESKLDRALWGRRFQIKDSLLKAIRVAEHETHVTRITLETHRLCDYSITPVPDSHRLLIELRIRQGQT
jgi:AMIN domain-containing protein